MRRGLRLQFILPLSSFSNLAKQPTVFLALAMLAVAVAEAQKLPQGACQKTITFALLENGALVYQLPKVSIEWLEKTEKKFSGVCFSQLASRSTDGERQYLVVLSTSKADFTSLFPVFRTDTTTNTTPVSGSGTVIDNYGSTWSYTFRGSVTTTTTTTTQANVPYTDTTTKLYANAYNEVGTSIGGADKSATFRQGGDAANTLGYNLASMLMSRNLGERLLEDIIKKVSARSSAKDEAEVRAMAAKNDEMAERSSPQAPDVILQLMEGVRSYLNLHPDDAEAKSSWTSYSDSYCQANPNSSYFDLDGNAQSCGGIARQAFLMMEKLRHEITNLQATKDRGFGEMAIVGARSSWFDMRKIYCDNSHEGGYIDLDGKPQSCGSK